MQHFWGIYRIYTAYLSSWELNIEAVTTGRGQLYLLTREEEPFCAHQFQLQIFNSFNDLPLRTIGRLEAILEGDGGLNETFEISEWVWVWLICQITCS